MCVRLVGMPGGGVWPRGGVGLDLLGSVSVCLRVARLAFHIKKY